MLVKTVRLKCGLCYGRTFDALTFVYFPLMESLLIILSH